MISKAKNFIYDKFPFLRSLIGVDETALKLQSSKTKIDRILNERKRIFLELGAGDKKGERGWLTIDMTKNCDIFWDLRMGLPFPDETISKIYSSHLFEHLSFREIGHLLNDCRRVLIPGGTFSICVPNARLYIEAYLNADASVDSRLFSYKPAHNNTTRIDYVNYIAYMDGHHKYMFDEDNLLYILKSNGFTNARLRPFDPSLDLQERDFESIYAEAEK